MFDFFKKVFKTNSDNTQEKNNTVEQTLLEKKQEEYTLSSAGDGAIKFAKEETEKLLHNITSLITSNSTISKRVIDNLEDYYGNFFYDALIPIGIVESEINMVFKDGKIPYSVKLYKEEVTKEYYSTVEYGYMKAMALVEKFMSVQHERDNEEKNFIMDKMEMKQEEFVNSLLS